MGQLVKESTVKPQKLHDYRKRLQLMELKKEMIEEVTTKLLSVNLPIVRVQQVQ